MQILQCNVITDYEGELLWVYQLAVPTVWGFIAENNRQSLLVPAVPRGWGQWLQMTSALLCSLSDLGFIL